MEDAVPVQNPGRVFNMLAMHFVMVEPSVAATLSDLDRRVDRLFVPDADDLPFTSRSMSCLLPVNRVQYAAELQEAVCAVRFATPAAQRAACEMLIESRGDGALDCQSMELQAVSSGDLRASVTLAGIREARLQFARERMIVLDREEGVRRRCVPHSSEVCSVGLLVTCCACTLFIRV